MTLFTRTSTGLSAGTNLRGKKTYPPQYSRSPVIDALFSDEAAVRCGGSSPQPGTKGWQLPHRKESRGVIIGGLIRQRMCRVAN